MKKTIIYILLITIAISCNPPKENSETAIDNSNEHEQIVDKLENDIQDTSQVHVSGSYSKDTAIDNRNEYEKLMDKLENNFQDTSKVYAIGSYSNVTATEDHSYGYNVKLWQIENTLIGVFGVHDGIIETKRRGPMIKGEKNEDNLSFLAWTKLTKGFADWEKSKVILYEFTGKQVDDKIIGELIIIEQNDTSRIEIEREPVELPIDEMYGVENHKNITDWMAYYDYAIDLFPPEK